MKKRSCFAAVLAVAFPLLLRAETEAESTLTRVGQEAPAVEWVTLDDKNRQ